MLGAGNLLSNTGGSPQGPACSSHLAAAVAVSFYRCVRAAMPGGRAAGARPSLPTELRNGPQEVRKGVNSFDAPACKRAD
jgi:hypothetical protein